jgi:AmmeMemoRadiSam system protein A
VASAPPGTEALQALLAREGETLLRLARESIRYRLDTARPLPIELADFAEELRAPGAAFITLSLGGQLRGCIGSPEARQPLAIDVADNAAAAAFEDPRFEPVANDEFANVGISVSVLTPPTEIPATSEAELLASLRVGEDGVILRAGGRRALFLPQMWAMLPEPQEFMAQLKYKAGLPPDFWSPETRVWRFVAVSVKSENYSLVE